VTQRTINRITYVGKQKNKNKNMINKRKEHLEWCKKRAMEYIERGESMDAWLSFLSDMGKHEGTANHPALLLGMQMQMAGHQIEKFINGFN
jgi:hypothetical protein